MKARTSRRRLGFVFEALALLVLSMGMGWAAMQAFPSIITFDGPVPQAEPQVADHGGGGDPVEAGGLSLEQAAELFKSGKAVFLDARRAEDFKRGHIPGAVNLSPGIFGDEIEARLAEYGKDQIYVAYCSNLRCPMAEQMAQALDLFGFSRVEVFPGGLRGWVEGGGPVETGKGTPPRLSARPEPATAPEPGPATMPESAPSSASEPDQAAGASGGASGSAPSPSPASGVEPEAVSDSGSAAPQPVPSSSTLIPTEPQPETETVE